MPIRSDLKHLYSGQHYKQRRAAILERAKHRCENCGVPNHLEVYRRGGYWFDIQSGLVRASDGSVHPGHGFTAAELRKVRIVLTVAHLDQNPENNAMDNQKALCQWCHLAHDRPYNLLRREGRRRELLAVACAGQDTLFDVRGR